MTPIQSVAHCIHDPAARKWIDENNRIFAAYCWEVHRCGPSECGADAIMIDTAAWQIWHDRVGTPCWSELDVERWLDRFAGTTPDDETRRHHAVITLHAFYCFLVKHQHLSRQQALKVVDQLEPLTARAVEQLLPALMAAGPADASRSQARSLN